MTCLFKEGYFTRSGRLQRKTIQNLQDDGKISVQDLPKLIDLFSRSLAFIDPEIMKVADEAGLGKKVLDYVDEHDEKKKSFRF